jgi:hypothetical protein
MEEKKAYNVLLENQKERVCLEDMNVFDLV